MANRFADLIQPDNTEQTNRFRPALEGKIKKDPIGFWESFVRDPIKGEIRAPFNPFPIADAVGLGKAGKRLQGNKYQTVAQKREAGDTLMPVEERLYGDEGLSIQGREQKREDERILKEYFEKQEELADRGSTFGGKVGGVLGQLPAFAAEFFLTGGAATAGKKLALKGAEKALGKAAQKTAGKVATKVAGFVGGTAARAAAIPTGAAKAAAERQIPLSFNIDDNGETSVQLSKESPMTSVFKGIGDHYIEIATESMGGALSAGAGRITHMSSKLLKKLPFAGKAMGKLEKAWIQLKPFRTSAKFAETIADKTGFHGMLEELGEERVGTILRAITDVDDFGAGEDANMWERLKAGASQDLKNLPVELVAFSVPGAARNVAARTLGGAEATVEKQEREEDQFVEAATEKIVNSEMTQEEKEAELDKILDAPEQILAGVEFEAEEVPTSPKALAEKMVNETPTPVEKKLLSVLQTAKRMSTEKIAERKQEFSRRVKKAQAKLFKGQGEQAFSSALSELKGELPGTSFELENTLTKEETNELVEKIRTSPILTTFEKINVRSALNSVLNDGKVPAQFERKLLDKVFGKEIGNTLADFAKFSNSKFKRLWSGVLNIPRTTLASSDISAVGRQGFFAGVGQPKIWADMYASSLKTLVSDKAARKAELEIRLNPFFDLSQNSNLVMRDYGAGTENKADEYTAADLIRRPKGLSEKKGANRFLGEVVHALPTVVEASERSYVTSLNKMRMDLFAHYAKSWEGTNKTKEDYKALAQVINHATGESRIKFLEDNSGILNASFFAPRWTASRFQLIGDLGMSNKAGRQIVAQMWIKYLTAGATAMSMFAAGGADVELDPRSSDFGKIVMGNTRIDFWGGHTQMVRLTAGLITGQKKTSSGKIQDKSRLAVVGRFLESKSSPVAGLAVDALRGETFLGDDVYGENADFFQQFYNRTAPLFIQDIIDTARYQGVGSAMAAAPFAFSGIGVQTYPIHDTQHLTNEKDRLAKETFGKEWDELGPLLQKGLTDHNPQLDRMDRKIKAERDDFDFIGKSLEEQQDAGRDVLKLLPKDVQREMDSLLVGVGGLSRRIGSNWYLNDKAYDKYKRSTTKVLSKVLPKITRKPMWNTLTEEQQQAILDEVISKAKQAVRKGIVDDAKREDLITLQQRKGK